MALLAKDGLHFLSATYVQQPCCAIGIYFPQLTDESTGSAG